MKALLCTCLLWALFSTVACLECIFCADPHGQCDNTMAQTCEDDEDVCMSLNLTNSAGIGIDMALKSCASSEICILGNYSSTTQQDIHTDTIMDCCGTDHCNIEALEVSPTLDMMIPNGLHCPACFSFGSPICLPLGMVECLGEELLCATVTVSLNLTAILPSGFLAFRGCVTPNTCGFPEPPLTLENNGFGISVTNLECSPASMNGTLPKGILPNGTAPLPG